VIKKFVNEGSITKFTKILCHENLELYGTHHVWAYDLKEDNWTRLPDCPQQDAGLSIVCGLLTAVGGRTNDGDVTNTLVSLTESHSKWTEHFPPMPMELDYPAALSMGNHLVVVANLERKVQVMNTFSLPAVCHFLFSTHHSQCAGLQGISLQLFPTPVLFCSEVGDQCVAKFGQSSSGGLHPCHPVWTASSCGGTECHRRG